MSNKIFSQFVLDSIGQHKGENLSDYLEKLGVERLELFTGTEKNRLNFFFVPSGFYHYQGQIQRSEKIYQGRKTNQEALENNSSENIESSQNYEGIASVMQIAYNIDEFVKIYSELESEFEPFRNISFDRENKVFIKNAPIEAPNLAIRKKLKYTAKAKVMNEYKNNANNFGFSEIEFAVSFDKIYPQIPELENAVKLETRKLVSELERNSLFEDDHKSSVHEKIRENYGITDLCEFNNIAQFQATFSRIAKEYSKRTIEDFFENKYTLEELMEKREKHFLNLNLEEKREFIDYASDLSYKIHQHFHGELIDKYCSEKLNSNLPKDISETMKEMANQEVQKLSKGIRRLILRDLTESHLRVAEDSITEEEWQKNKNQIQVYIQNNYQAVSEKLISKAKPILNEKFTSLKSTLGENQNILLEELIKRNLNYCFNNLVDKNGDLKNNLQSYSNFDKTLLTKLFDTKSRECKNPILFNKLFENYINAVNEKTVGTYERIPTQYRTAKRKNATKTIYEELKSDEKVENIIDIVKKSVDQFAFNSKDHFEYRDLMDIPEMRSNIRKQFAFDILLHEIKTTVNYAGAMLFNKKFKDNKFESIFGEIPYDQDAEEVSKYRHLYLLNNLLSVTKLTAGLNPYNMQHTPTRQQEISKDSKKFQRELNRKHRVHETLGSILKGKIHPDFKKYLVEKSIECDVNVLINTYQMNDLGSIEECIFNSAAREFNGITDSAIDKILFLSLFNESVRDLNEEGEVYYDIFDGNFKRSNNKKGLYIAPKNNRDSQIKIKKNGEVVSEIKIPQSNELFENKFLYSTSKKNNVMIIQETNMTKDFVKSEIQTPNPKFSLCSLENFLKLAVEQIKARSEKVETKTKSEKVIEKTNEVVEDVIDYITEIVMSTSTGKKIITKIQEKRNGENDTAQINTGTGLIKYQHDKLEKRNKF